ncbi:type VI secretion system tip protein VgrG [Ideonella azotifigens]|uniref:Type VI secretion system spike protein VgrG1b n=1 Tax=Ideonella azotifigens TaxID=513160 RepID=A0ABN1K4K7_9BURK|nr:type VI secretion system tip protein TssI/VgrG [Ideonella azotifigens]MCD2344356.1 type VI secretion system tip protein VgrG [Ideonella azotifigens]
MPSASITLSSPLPPDDLLFESMFDGCGLSVLGETQLGLLSEKPDILSTDLLGKTVSVAVTLRDGGKRYFHGHVTRFGIGPHRGRYHAYQATVRPWLWFLTRTTDCRIFQDLTVPDIVKKVFEDHTAIAHFEFKLYRSYRPWVYCVQYRETDYNFIARLLEHEGIYWYFEHTATEHKLVLVDAYSAHDPAPHCERLPYHENTDQLPPDADYVSNWSFSCGVKTGQAALTSYDFERPATSLAVKATQPRGHDLDKLEAFDYQGDYLQVADGTQYNEDRLTELQSTYVSMRGASNAQGLTTGHVLTLEKHPREDQNIKYLISAMRTNAVVDGYESQGGAPGGYQCTFDAIPADQQFRPPRQTAKPFVQGPQTAVVVGPSGEEIYTDRYGRVKVQFHWDRYGQHNETSSCWVRVSHPWAGKNFGVMHVPRIGQEVVVDFLEGDPDQPLVTGRVYNAMQMPPWDLPANATQSGILTRSSKGGAYGTANAIRFEDKAGAEQLWIHAEKNQDIEVENDETHWVGHDRKKTIDNDETVHVKHDRTETVDNNETITIGVNRTEKVGSNEKITIGVDRSEKVGNNETIVIGVNRNETVGSNETISIGSNRSITVGSSETATVAMQRTHTVGVNETITVGAAQEVTIGAIQAITVGASQTTTVGLNQSNSIGANQSTDVGAKQSTSVGSDRSVSVGGAQSTSVGKKRSTSVTDDDSLSVGKNLVIDAGESITIKTGGASIVMKKDGTVVIKGKDVSVDGSGKINVKASSDIVIKGSKVGLN